MGKNVICVFRLADKVGTWCSGCTGVCRQAVQEFAELCDTLELDDVKAVMPFWPRLYRKLATDVDK